MSDFTQKMTLFSSGDITESTMRAEEDIFLRTLEEKRNLIYVDEIKNEGKFIELAYCLTVFGVIFLVASLLG